MPIQQEQLQQLQNQHACTTCAVSFHYDMKNAHYKSDWHRYNIKRRLAEMPAVTLQVFNEITAKHQEKMKVKSSLQFLVFFCNTMLLCSPKINSSYFLCET